VRHGDPEEAFGEKLPDVRPEPLENLKPPLHPDLLLPKRPRQGVDREPLATMEVREEIEFLGECGSARWIVELEALELGLEPVPGFDDGPCGGNLPVSQSKEALETVYEEKPAALLDHHERIIAVESGRASGGGEELERDLLQGDLPRRHGRCLPSCCSFVERERTWKVG
jgi:hypothetical protein